MYPYSNVTIYKNNKGEGWKDRKHGKQWDQKSKTVERGEERNPRQRIKVIMVERGLWGGGAGMNGAPWRLDEHSWMGKWGQKLASTDRKNVFLMLVSVGNSLLKNKQTKKPTWLCWFVMFALILTLSKSEPWCKFVKTPLGRCQRVFFLGPLMVAITRQVPLFFRRTHCELEVRGWTRANQFFKLTFHWNKSCLGDRTDKAVGCNDLEKGLVSCLWEPCVIAHTPHNIKVMQWSLTWHFLQYSERKRHIRGHGFSSM